MFVRQYYLFRLTIGISLFAYMNPVLGAPGSLSRRGRPPAVTVVLKPIDHDRPAALRLGRAAIAARDGPGAEADRSVAKLDASIAEGSVPGGIVLLDGEPRGVAIWDDPCSLGASLDLFYLEPAAATGDRYREFLRDLEQLLGPVAFVAGPLAGLGPGEDSELMTALGFAPYGRSEMRLPPDAVLPEPRVAPPLRLRRAEAADQPELARLHARAYHGSLDRYLFWNDDNEEVDARVHVLDIFRGRWGPLIPHGSWVATEGDRLVGGVLSLRTDSGALIGDVMVDPGHWGTGVGRACLLASLRAMRSANEPPAYLNVTEGNEAALHLYAHVGFVRSVGPTRDWYNTARVPVPSAAARGAAGARRLGLPGLVGEAPQGAEGR